MFEHVVLILLLFALVIASYEGLKIGMLYRPIKSSPEKYQKFFSRMVNDLVESSDLIENNPIQTQDGFILDTVYVKNPHSERCIIFFHSNEGNLSMRYDMIKFLYTFGSVVIFDYRSYGFSSGKEFNLNCDGLHKDAYAIWKYVTSILKYYPNKVTLFGESLGCPIAIKLAAELSKTLNDNMYPHSLILNSPVSSLSDVINRKFNTFNYSILESLFKCIESDYHSIDLIKYVSHTTQIIIAHSYADEVNPYSEGKKLFNSTDSRPNIKFIDLHGTHYNVGLTKNYIYSVSEMLQE